MRAEVLRWSLRERRRSFAWWAIGIAAAIGLTIAFYPSLRESAGLSDYARNLPDSLRALFVGGQTDITSGPGYLQSQVYAMLAPLLMLIFAIAIGTDAVAGEEERGNLELALAQPLTRTRLVAERFGALVLLVTAMSVVVLAAVAVAGAIVGLDGVSVGDLGAAGLGVWLLGLVFGALGLCVGAAFPGRARATGIAAGIAVLAWMLDGLGAVVGWLGGARPASPFYQAVGRNPLVSGIPVLSWLAMAAVAAGLVAIAAAAFSRRDLRG